MSARDDAWMQPAEPATAEMVAVGEPLQAYLGRRVRENPFLQELKARDARLQPPSLEGLHPADWTDTT